MRKIFLIAYISHMFGMLLHDGMGFLFSVSSFLINILGKIRIDNSEVLLAEFQQDENRF